MASATVGERSLVLFLAGVQFVNVLDFMMVSPLGPQFTESLHIPTSQLPLISGSYTASACVAGLLGSLFLERFDRRRALVVLLVGLGIGTAIGGFATGLGTLILARLLAGAFGGPATSIALAILADAIPVERRGAAMGTVMMGFAVASVVGVPVGLFLANLGTWRTPFFGVAALIMVAAAVAFYVLRGLPTPERGAAEVSPLAGLWGVLSSSLQRRSLLLTSLVMMSGFIIIPSFAPYMQFNLGFPGERLDLVYLIGGAVSLITTKAIGPLIDRFGSARVVSVATVILLIVTWLFFLADYHLPVLLLSSLFFFAMSMRAVSYNTLTSKVPAPHERARFQSVQSAFQHGASALAAGLSSKILSEASDHKLVHIERVAIISMALAALIPLFMFIVERRLSERHRQEGY